MNEEGLRLYLTSTLPANKSAINKFCHLTQAPRQSGASQNRRLVNIQHVTTSRVRKLCFDHVILFLIVYLPATCSTFIISLIDSIYLGDPEATAQPRDLPWPCTISKGSPISRGESPQSLEHEILRAPGADHNGLDHGNQGGGKLPQGA